MLNFGEVDIVLEYSSTYDTDYNFGILFDKAQPVVVNHDRDAWAPAPEGTCLYNRGEEYYYTASGGRWVAVHKSFMVTRRQLALVANPDTLDWHYWDSVDTDTM